MSEFMSKLGGGERIAIHPMRGFGRDKGIHHRKIDRVGITSIEPDAQRNGRSAKFTRSIPFVVAGGSALGIVAGDSYCQSEIWVSFIKRPLIAPGFSGEK